MKMGLVLWDRFVRIEWFVHVNQQMMMAAVLKIVACMRDAHVAQDEATPKSAFDDRAVLRPNEIQNRILRRGHSMSLISNVRVVTIAVRRPRIALVVPPGSGPNDMRHAVALDPR